MHIFLTINHGALIFCLAVYCLYGASFFWILFVYLRLRPSRMPEEQRTLALPLPEDEALPAVLVQIPTFNEGPLIGRIAAAIQTMDWPREKLHVQILDDSNDGSVLFADKAADALRSNGIEASVLHRTDRAGFKAGALAQGLTQSHAPYIAIFDSDYIPPSDFLRCCIRPLLHKDSLALVQARCDYLNADQNWLTFTQRRVLDSHFAVEQAARCWSGEPMPFNGTCGIWRRAAIDDSGGWQGDTLAEDMDVSYRAQLKRWKTLLLVSVAVPGELPENFSAWRAQQARWATGTAEVAGKLLSAVWRSDLTFRQKLGSTVHLGGAWLAVLLPLTIGLLLIDLVFGPGFTPMLKLLIVFTLVGVIGGPAALQLTGQWAVRGANPAREILYLPIVTAIRIAAGLSSLAASMQALFGRKTAFIRTPKAAFTPKSGF